MGPQVAELPRGNLIGFDCDRTSHRIAFFRLVHTVTVDNAYRIVFFHS